MQARVGSSPLFGGVLSSDATEGQNLREIAAARGIALTVDRAQLTSFIKARNRISANIEHPALRVESGSALGVGTTRPHFGGIEGPALDGREDLTAKFRIFVPLSILIEGVNRVGKNRRIHLDAAAVIHEFVRALSGTDHLRQFFDRSALHAPAVLDLLALISAPEIAVLRRFRADHAAGRPS